MIDKDKNGKMTKEELREMFEGSEQKDDSLWSDIFDEVDANKDGFITFEEFVDCMDKVIVSHNKDSYQK